MFPKIVVEGGALSRGQQYGEGQRERIHRSVDAYRDVFGHYAGWSWERVRREAERFRAPISAFNSNYLTEMSGIAQGASIDEGDILAINVRTEVMFAAMARKAERSASEPPVSAPAECSSFAVLPSRSEDERMYVGQTWDWLSHARETTIVLEVHQPSGPDFVTVVEAGLLAKVGMNSAGIGLNANALVTSADIGAPGVPMHILLRGILDSETISDALVTLQRQVRASSANYLVSDQDGLAVNIEAAPGDYSALRVSLPSDGLILHTNHFLRPPLNGRDASLFAMPDSPFRLQRLQQSIGERRSIGREHLAAALSDHASFPLGVCAHPDPRLPLAEQSETVAALIMDVQARRLWLADGNPCSTKFERQDLRESLSKAGPFHSYRARESD